MTIITIRIDLAKNIFAVHDVNENGRAEPVKPKVSHDQLLPLIAQLPPFLIGIEAPVRVFHQGPAMCPTRPFVISQSIFLHNERSAV